MTGNDLKQFSYMLKSLRVRSRSISMNRVQKEARALGVDSPQDFGDSSVTSQSSIQASRRTDLVLILNVRQIPRVWIGWSKEWQPEIFLAASN